MTFRAPAGASVSTATLTSATASVLAPALAKVHAFAIALPLAPASVTVHAFATASAFAPA